MEATEMTLKELRKEFPDIKAKNKKLFMEALNARLVDSREEKDEVVVTPVLESNELAWKTIVDYLLGESKTNKKILIKVQTSFDSDFLYLHLKEKLFGKLEEEGMSIMANANRRDIHINGSCYVRIACENKYNLVKSQESFNTFKTIKV